MTSENSEFLRMRGPSTGRRARRTPPLQLPQPRVAAIAVRDPSLTARDRLMQPRCQQLQNKGKTGAMAKINNRRRGCRGKNNSQEQRHAFSSFHPYPPRRLAYTRPTKIAILFFFDEEKLLESPTTSSTIDQSVINAIHDL